MALIDLNPERSLITIPGVQKYRRSSDGLWVTPALGKSGVREVLLGSDGSTEAQFPSLIKPRGFYFDGGDQLNAGDADIFTFADDSGDKPFSFAALIRAISFASIPTIIMKGSSTVDGEYSLYISNTGVARFFTIDVSNGSHQYVETNNMLDEGVPTIIIATYSGSGFDTGLDIALNGKETPVSRTTIGAYTRMRNTGDSLKFGSREGGSRYFLGNIIAPMLFDFELTPEEVQALTERYKSLYSITPR